MVNLFRASHKPKTFICFTLPKKLIPFLNKALLSKYFLASLLAFYPSFLVARKHIISWLGWHYNSSKETREKRDRARNFLQRFAQKLENS